MVSMGSTPQGSNGRVASGGVASGIFKKENIDTHCTTV